MSTEMSLDMYREAADAYLSRLTLTNFAEASQSGTQRKITLLSLDLLSRYRPDVHVFNEMLVQFPSSGGSGLVQVVPDNMVVLRDEPFGPIRSYAVPLEQAKPIWVLEYVSRGSKRKDYKKNFRIYERQLGVKYYLLFEPDKEALRVYRLENGRYVEAPRNEERYVLAELELEVGKLDGWVRFWFRGELLLLPGDLQSQVESEREQRRAAEANLAATRADLATTQAKLEEEHASRVAVEAENARLRAEMAALRRQ